MAGARFFLSPDEVSTYQADKWESAQNTKLADTWAQRQLAQLNAEVAPPPAQPAQPTVTDQNLPEAQPAPAPVETAPAAVPEPPAAEPAIPPVPQRFTAPTVLTPPQPESAPPVPQRFTAPTVVSQPTPASPSANGLVDYARQAAQRAGIDPDLFVRQINQESGFNPNAGSPAGALGIAQIVPRFHPNVDPMNPQASLDYAANLMKSHLQTYGGDVRKALIAYNGGQGAVAADERGQTYGESKTYVDKILGGSGQTAAAAPVATANLSQFGDKTLTAEEAYAACGPAAASRLAATYGNSIPLSVALQAAKQVGWTTGGGMNGIANQKKLLDALNIPSELDTSGDWGRIVSDAGQGRMVTISTPGHYFTANGARPGPNGQTELYVGQSGLDLKGGKAWMTPAEIEGVMGKLNGALFSDPSKSVAAGTWMQTASQQHGSPIETPEDVLGHLGQAQQKAGVSAATQAQPFGDAFNQVGAWKDQVGSAIGGAVQGVNAAVRSAIGADQPQTMNLGSSNAPGAATAPEAIASEVAAAIPRGTMLTGGMNLANAAVPNTDPNAPTMPTGGQLLGSYERSRVADDQRALDLTDKFRGLKPNDPSPLTPEDAQWLSEYWKNTAQAVAGADVNLPGGGANAIRGMMGGASDAVPRILGGTKPSVPPGPVTQGSQANNTLLNMYGKVKTEEANAVPTQLEEARRFVVRKWTDRGIDLAEFQKDAQKAVGRPLTADEMAYEMRRLNPAGAAEMRVQNELKPAIQSVGQDADWLRVYLTHKDNIDVARAMGQRVEGAAVDAIPETNAAVQNAQATLRGRQQYLDRLTADASTPPEAIRTAQNAVNSAQRSVDGAEASYASVRDAKITEATRSGAQAAAERKFSGGLSVADSQAGLADMAQQIGPERMAKVEQAGQQIVDYGKSLLQRKVDSGLISQELFNELTTKYPNYSPTRITDYLKDPAGIPSGRKITVQSAGLKSNTIEGTVRQREDPLASFVRLGYETEALATKNEVAQAFLKLRDLNPDASLMIRKVADDVATPRGYEKMKVFENGVPQTYQMPDYMAKAIKEEPVAAIPLLTPLMNMFRMVATQRNPLFLASNALNDSVAYTLRTSSRLGGPQNAPRVAIELVKAYGDAFQGILKGEFRGDTARYIEGGGAMSGFFSHSAEDARKVADALQRPHAFAIRSDHVVQDIGRLVGQALTLKPIEALGERIELAPRVAAMRLAENAGATQQQAVLAGRTVTIDFSQGGTWAKVLNQVIPFFNVAVQSGAQLPRAFAENPRGFVTTAAGLLAAPTVAMEAWNRSDPQRAKDYADVPQYVKDAGLVFMLPVAPQTDEKGNRKPQYLFLPLREYSPFAVLTREAAGRAMGSDPRGWAELLAGAGKSVSPVSGNSGADVFSTGVPLGVSTAMQLATDRDWYRNSHIVSQHADEQASAFSKAAAEALQKMGIAARPSAVEFAARDIGAGVGGMVLAGSDMVAGKPRRDERIQSTPGVGGLIGRFVQDRTGEQLNRAIDQPVSVDVEKALHEAGLPTPMLPYTISVKSQMTGSNSPPIELRQAERAEYQRLMSERLNERLKPILADPGWAQRPIANRNKVLEAQVKAARDYAESRVYASMKPEDRQARMAAGREAAKPKPKP